LISERDIVKGKNKEEPLQQMNVTACHILMYQASPPAEILFGLNEPASDIENAASRRKNSHVVMNSMPQVPLCMLSIICNRRRGLKEL
jgi:hypothetical protein